MNKFGLGFVAVAACLAAAQALTCYKCDVGLFNLCFTTQTTCSAGQQCFSGVGIAAGFVNITKKGCLAVSSCNQTESVNFPSTNSSSQVYTMTKTCCSTDLCNSAPLALRASALGLALSALSLLLQP